MTVRKYLPLSLGLFCTTITSGFLPSLPSLAPVSLYPERPEQTLKSATSLFAQGEEQKGASVRFTASDELTTTQNPLDSFLSLLASDVASIALGAVGLLIVVVHRLSLLDASVDAMAVQTRTDLLAVFACGSVLLNGVTKLDVTAALSESVVLEGTKLAKPEFLTSQEENDLAARSTIAWGLDALLDATPAETAVLLERRNGGDGWIVSARSGIVPASTSVPEISPILARVGAPSNTKETYLPTLQALPGKKELTYLPANAQLALMIPMEGEQVLVLCGNTAKSFSPRDVAWSRIIAERMGNPQ